MLNLLNFLSRRFLHKFIYWEPCRTRTSTRARSCGGCVRAASRPHSIEQRVTTARPREHVQMKTDGWRHGSLAETTSGEGDTYAAFDPMPRPRVSLLVAPNLHCKYARKEPHVTHNAGVLCSERTDPTSQPLLHGCFNNLSDNDQPLWHHAHLSVGSCWPIPQGLQS